MAFLFQHIKENGTVYQKLLDEKDFSKKVMQMIKKQISHSGETNEWESTYIANGIIGVISYWLEKDMKETVKEMSLRLTKITLFPSAKFD